MNYTNTVSCPYNNNDIDYSYLVQVQRISMILMITLMMLVMIWRMISMMIFMMIIFVILTDLSLNIHIIQL